MSPPPLSLMSYASLVVTFLCMPLCYHFVPATLSSSFPCHVVIVMSLPYCHCPVTFLGKAWEAECSRSNQQQNSDLILLAPHLLEFSILLSVTPRSSLSDQWYSQLPPLYYIHPRRLHGKATFMQSRRHCLPRGFNLSSDYRVAAT
jgi:hypothetical protein